MQQNLLRSLLVAFALLPAIAVAHPGHSAFDPTVVPHPGHAGEYLLAFCGVVGAAFFASRVFWKKRR
jgi:hypothetical protein